MSGSGKGLWARLRYVARATVFPQSVITTKREFVLAYGLRLLSLVGRRLWKDRCQQQAAALAFQTLLSFVPLLAVAVAVASHLDMSWFEVRFTEFLKENLLPEAAQAVGARISGIIRHARPDAMGIVGAATLLPLSLVLLFNIERMVNDIFRITAQRRFLVRVVYATLLLVAAPPAIGVSLYLTRGLIAGDPALDALRALALTIVALFLCYWLLPHRKVRARLAAAAATTAGVFFETAKWLFALYAHQVGGTLSILYGAFAIVPLFLVWLYTAWLIFLFGAELSAALHEVQRRDGLGLSSGDASAIVPPDEEEVR